MFYELEWIALMLSVAFKSDKSRKVNLNAFSNSAGGAMC